MRREACCKPMGKGLHMQWGLVRAMMLIPATPIPGQGANLSERSCVLLVPAARARGGAARFVIDAD